MHLLLKDWPTFAWTIQGRFQKLRKLVAAGCTNISAKGHDLALQSGEGRCEGCLHLPLSLQLSRAASRIYNWQCQSQAASADTAQVPSTGGTLPIHRHSFIHSAQSPGTYSPEELLVLAPVQSAFPQRGHPFRLAGSMHSRARIYPVLSVSTDTIHWLLSG